MCQLHIPLFLVTDQAGSMYGSGGGGTATNMSGQPMKARDPRLAGQGAPPPPHFAKPPAGGPQQQRYRPNADPELRQQELLNNMQPKKRATGIPRTFLNLSGPSAPVEGGGEGGMTGDGEGGETDNGDLATQLQPSAQAFQALVRTGGGQSLNDASKRRDLDYALKLTATSIPDHLQCGICHSIVKNAMLVPWDTEGRPTCESCIRDGLTKNGFTCPLTGTEGVSPDDLFPNVGLRKAADMFIADVMDKMDSIERQIEAENEEEEKKRVAEALKRKDLEGNEFDDGGDGILTKRTKLNGKKSTNTTNDDLLFGGDDEFGGDVFDVAVDEDDEAEPEDMDEAIIEPVVDNTKPVISKEEGKGTAATTETDDTSKKNDADNNNDQKNTSTNSDTQNSDNPDATAAVKTNGDDQQGKKDNDDPSSPSKSSTADASSSSSTPAQKEKRVRRAPPAGYVLGPAGSSASGASPSTVPPNNMGGNGNNSNMPPMHGNNPNMPPMNMGRGFGPGGRGNGPPQGRGFFPGNNGGRFPQQSFPPHMQQQQGNFPPQNGPGFNGGGPGFNNNGPDWNRKRGHEDMMMGQQQGGPPNNMYNQQGPPQGRGGWGGRGFPNQQFGGRGPPGRGFQGRGYQGRGGFQGRGGRGNWGGRGRGGRW